MSLQSDVDRIEECAPAGATHYINVGGAITYLMCEHNCHFYHSINGWKMYFGTFGKLGKLPLNVHLPIIYSK